MISVKRLMTVGVIGALLAAAPLVGPAAVDSVKGGTALAAESSSTITQRTIVVTGEGKMTIQPDVAYVNFGVFTKAQTANEAQSANAKAMASIKKVLTEQFGIAEKDMKTNGFYVQPEYTYPQNGGQPTITGYTADHTLLVTYRDLNKIGAMLDAVSKVGANKVNGIQFGTEKSQQYELQAIEKAMANAEAKAQAIAKYAKSSVKGILTVQQQGMGGVPPIYHPYAKMAAESSSAAADTSIQPGELEFSTMVNVTFEMQ